MGDSIRNIPVIKAALKPLSWLYGGITDLRNLGYDKGWFTSYRPAFKTISIGNLTVGGTGKTPMTEWLIRLLQDRYSIVVVSRGYGRKTRGLIVADRTSSAGEIGDEPAQYLRKFSPRIRVIVAEKRAEAARKIENDFPGTDMILLDDALQHRAIKRDLNILLTDYNRPFYRDFPFPAGNLRERRKGARRADAVIVTKCPANMDPSERHAIITQIHTYARQKPEVFFSTLRYGAALPFEGNSSLRSYPGRIALSGLAQNASFEKLARETYSIKTFKGFDDHYDYTQQDLLDTGMVQNPALALITTEKDMVKLLPLARSASVAARCFYVPVETDLAQDTERFTELVLIKATGRDPA